jgi:hypothetical protein
LEYLRERGYKYDSETCAAAALGGNLECLKYLRHSGCEWDRTTCEGAALGGHLECLRYPSLSLRPLPSLPSTLSFYFWVSAFCGSCNAWSMQLMSLKIYLQPLLISIEDFSCLLNLHLAVRSANLERQNPKKGKNARAGHESLASQY